MMNNMINIQENMKGRNDYEHHNEQLGNHESKEMTMNTVVTKQESIKTKDGLVSTPMNRQENTKSRDDDGHHNEYKKGKHKGKKIMMNVVQVFTRKS